MNVISINVPNFITIALIALIALAVVNFVQVKTGKKLPYLS